MSERGLAGILVLWLLAGATALASGVLAMAKRQDARGSRALAQTQALFLAHAGARLAHAADLPAESKRYEFAKGTVSTTVTPATARGVVTLHLAVATHQSSMNVEIDWKRVSGQWQAVAWRER